MAPSATESGAEGSIQDEWPIPIVTLVLRHPDVLPVRVDIPLPVRVVWDVFDILATTAPKRLTLDDATVLAVFGGAVLVHVGAVCPELPPRRVHAVMRKAYDLVKEWVSQKPPELYALEYTYAQLRERTWTDHDTAARFASHLLRRPYTREQWRRKMQRLADERGWPRVELRKR